jgi:hypothetical protein
MTTKEVRLYARGKLLLFGCFELKLISTLDSLTLKLIPTAKQTEVVTFPNKLLLGIFPYDSTRRSENQKRSMKIKFTGDNELICVLPRNDGYSYFNAHKIGE